jgi:hypothetical protein
MRLDRASERRGEFGGITADGMINVLGRPRFDSLALVLREAAQNSWDARLRSSARGWLSPPGFRVRIRTLSVEHERAFREAFHDPATEAESAATNELRAHLALTKPIRVLEVCDFDTVGLNGPVNPSSPVAAGSDNFRNFFFDLGVEHVASGDGGTYGYGRSALYLASRARTILVDSFALVGSGMERRLMACRIGHAHERKGFAGGASTRYTGRHFWGESNGDHGIRPVTGDRAAELAAAIGMPRRDEHATGTSILIPWPDSDARSVDGQWIWDVLLRHLWPKMVSRQGPLAMHLSVEDEEREVPAPDIHRHPIYGLFTSALLIARDRSGASGALPIELQRPSVVTGHLGLEVGAAVTAEPSGDEDPEQIRGFIDGVGHVALMRPSELVVRYLEVSGARTDGRQWAGVFICVDDADVRNVFASSEPPAHDDWIPDRIDDKQARRLVRQTVNTYIPQTVRAAFALASRPVGSDEDRGSLAAAADAFAREFLQGDGTAPAPPGPGGPGAGGSRGARLRGPTFAGLSLENGFCVATYRVAVIGAGPAGIRVRATASIATDGSSMSEVPVGMLQPDVLGWREASRSERTPGAVCRVTDDRELFIDVAFRGEYGVALSCAVETES